MSSNRMAGLALLLAGVALGTVLTTIIGAEGGSWACPEAPKPECVCKAEACSATECLPPVECPPQPTLEIRKPLSAELDAVMAECKPEVDRTLAKLDEAVDAAYEAQKAAKAVGVSGEDFTWLDREDAQKAAAEMILRREALLVAVEAAYDAQARCRSGMERLFHATDAWAWIDSEEMDEAMAGHRGFEDAFVETVGYELMNARCNAVARRLECPGPTSQAEAAP